MDMKLFGKRLKEERLRKNITPTELGEVVDVNKSTIHRWESGVAKSIRENVLEELAIYLAVSKDYLAGKTNERFNLDSLKNLNKKEKLEITNVIYVAKDLLKEDNVMLDDIPMTKEDIRYITNLIETALEMIRKKNNK